MSQLLEELQLPVFAGLYVIAIPENSFMHPCALHVDEIEIDPIKEDGSNLPSCRKCGCLISTDSCYFCGTSWIHFGNQKWDDTVRDGSGTMSGDFMCARCAEEYDEEENDMDPDYGWEEY